MDELRQYDPAGDSCGGGGPFMIDRRRRRRSACWRWYWPIFAGGSSSKEVFDVSGYELFVACIMVFCKNMFVYP